MDPQSDSDAVVPYETGRDDCFPCLMNESLPLFDDVDLSSTLKDPLVIVEPPGYMRQTFSGAQPANANGQAEGERIRNSFRSGSLWSLKKLPSKFESGAVTTRRLEETKKNLTFKSDKTYAAELGPLSKRAEKFVGTSYDKVNMLHKLDVDEDKFRNEYFSRKPFHVSSGVNKHPASGFIYPDFGPGAAIPDDAIARKPRDEDFIAGPFYKCVPPKAKEIPRTKAKFFVENMYKQMKVDWAHLMFSVKLTKEEIVIKFPTKSQILPAENALHKYMSRQAAHGDPQSWCLRKRGDRWGKVEIPSLEGHASSISSELDAQTHAKEPMLTFSYFLPWIADSVKVVTKKAAHASRQHVIDEKRKKMEERRLLEESFQREQSLREMEKRRTDSKNKQGRTRTKITETNINLDDLMKRRAEKVGSSGGRHYSVI